MLELQEKSYIMYLVETMGDCTSCICILERLKDRREEVGGSRESFLTALYNSNE